MNDGKLVEIVEFDLSSGMNGSQRVTAWFNRGSCVSVRAPWSGFGSNIERVGCAPAGLKCESVPWIRPWYSCISQSTSNRPSTG